MATDAATHLEQRIASLTQQVEELRALLVRQADSPQPGVSRRGLLTSLPVLAAAGAGAMALTGLAASPATAGPGDPVRQGMTNNAGATTTTLKSTKAIGWNVTSGMKSKTLHVGDATSNDNGDLSVLTHSKFTAYVECRQQVSSSGDKGGSAIYADGFMAPAIVVDAFVGEPKGAADPTDVKPGLGIAVRGHDSSPGIAVSTQLAGVFGGVQTDTKTKVAAATILTHGLGRGLVVSNVNKANAAGAVTGVTAGTGAGVVGLGGASGRGGQFAGGPANLRLMPSTASTHPASGAAGDLFVDSADRLWFCKGGATWTQLA